MPVADWQRQFPRETLNSAKFRRWVKTTPPANMQRCLRTLPFFFLFFKSSMQPSRYPRPEETTSLAVSTTSLNWHLNTLKPVLVNITIIRISKTAFMQTYVTAQCPIYQIRFFNSYYSTSGHATVTLMRIKVFVFAFTNCSSAKCSYMRINSDYTNDKYEW